MFIRPAEIDIKIKKLEETQSFALEKLIQEQRLFRCNRCGYISNIPDDHHANGCIICLGKAE